MKYFDHIKATIALKKYNSIWQGTDIKTKLKLSFKSLCISYYHYGCEACTLSQTAAKSITSKWNVTKELQKKSGEISVDIVKTNKDILTELNIKDKRKFSFQRPLDF